MTSIKTQVQDILQPIFASIREVVSDLVCEAETLKEEIRCLDKENDDLAHKIQELARKIQDLEGRQK